MDKMSYKASKFTALAHYLEHADEHGNPANAYTKAFTFEPSATIEDVFAAIWPKEQYGLIFGRTPVRIELVPDGNSLPDEPRNAFDDMLKGSKDSNPAAANEAPLAAK